MNLKPLTPDFHAGTDLCVLQQTYSSALKDAVTSCPKSRSKLRVALRLLQEWDATGTSVEIQPMAGKGGGERLFVGSTPGLSDGVWVRTDEATPSPDFLQDAVSILMLANGFDF